MDGDGCALDMQLVPFSTEATDLHVRPCAPDVGGVGSTLSSIMLVDLDPHPAPTPLNSTVSISETLLSYLNVIILKIIIII